MQLEKILERGFNRYNVPISIVIHTRLSVRFCHHEHHTLYGVYIWLISSESSMSTNSTIYIIHQLCPIKVAQKLTFWKKVEKFIRKLMVYQESWNYVIRPIHNRPPCPTRSNTYNHNTHILKSLIFALCDVLSLG